MKTSLRKLPLLLLLGGMAFSSSAATREAKLKVDDRITYQKITGFGGFAFSGQWGDNLTDSEITTMFGKGSKQLGYNILRARISPDEYTSWGYDCWGTTAAVIRKAKALGECHAFASAWTPPGKFTSNGQNTHGYMLAKHFGDYAEFLNRFIDRVVACGTDVDYISLQNEPDFDPDYEGCTWYAKQFIEFYINHAPNVKRPMIGPESLAFRWALSDSILKNDKACANLAIVGGHLYGGGNFDYPLVREKGKEKWMTEYLINNTNGDENYRYTLDDALLFSRVVNTSMLANYNAWCHYALKSSYGMIGDGTYGTTAGEVTKRGYILGHFAKYVTGTTRIKQTLTDPGFGLTSSCYTTSNRDSVIIMLTNIAPQAYSLELDLPFLAKNARRIWTNQSKNMAVTTLSFTESNNPTVNVPAKSVITLIIPKSGERTSPMEDDVLPVFHDSLTQYNGECVIPKGWKVTHNGSTFNGSGQYTSFWDGSKPRMYYYSPESPIPAGILLTAGSTSQHGIASYGTLNNYRLHLPAGDYRLIWHAIGWEKAQQLYCYVAQVGVSGSLAYHSGVAVNNHISGNWGTEHDTFGATADTINFTVTKEGNYTLNWKVTYQNANAVNGLCRALVGGIRLETVNKEETAIDHIAPDAQENGEPEYFDLSGRRISSPTKDGIYTMRTSKDGVMQTRKIVFTGQ